MAIYLVDTSGEVHTGGVPLPTEGVEVRFTGTNNSKIETVANTGLHFSVNVSDLTFFPSVVFSRKPYTRPKES